MKIEIYLKHIFQEYPVTESISIGSAGQAPIGKDPGPWKEWSSKYERNCGCRGNVAMPTMDIYRYNIQRIFLRPESFGGLLYDPTSAVIYKLDKDAYKVVQALRSYKDIEAIRRGEKSLDGFAKRNKLSVKKVNEFVEQLREYDLW